MDALSLNCQDLIHCSENIAQVGGWFPDAIMMGTCLIIDLILILNDPIQLGRKARGYLYCSAFTVGAAS